MRSGMSIYSNCRCCFSLLALITFIATAAFSAPETVQITAAQGGGFNISGTIYEDLNGNDTFDPASGKPVTGIAVSDGESVVLSDRSGAYRIQASPDARVVFMTRPPGYEFTRSFYHVLPSETSTSDTAQTNITKDLRYDFAIKRAAHPDSQTIRFVQTTDIHINSDRDREGFASAVEEISNLTPAADFVIATGDLVNSGEKIAQYEVYTSTTRLCRIPWIDVFGNHDANKGDDKAANYHRFLAPDYYAIDYGDLHLLMLNSVHRSARQNRWLENDLAVASRGRRLLAFQHHPPDADDLARLQPHDVRAVFSGHWHSNKITTQDKGLVSINHPTFLMGGIDGSPSSFRIVTIDGERITSEFRFNDFAKHIWITYPQGDLTGPERVLTQIYDTSGGVREARFRIATRETRAYAEGVLKQISPLAWMASLAPQDLGIKALPSDFLLRVRATNNAGEQWEASQPIARVRKIGSATPVKLGDDWPQFMRTAQRTGSAKNPIKLPLALRWFTPTHGSIDFGSPVLYKGRVAIGVKDRNNLINNGVAILDAKSGKTQHFIKTDAMINHSPAFAEDSEDGSGSLYAIAAGGTLYSINPESGNILSTSQLGTNQERWIYSSPVIQENLAVVGSSAMMMALTAKSGNSRWTQKFGADWISSYSSPSLAGPIVVMGSNWQDKDKTPCSIFALDSGTGQVRWTNECHGTHGSVSVAAGRGFAIDVNGLFKVIDLETGKDVYTKQLEKGWSMSTPAIDPEVIIVPTGAGTIHAFAFSDLSEKWSFNAKPGLWRMSPYMKTKEAVFSSPTIAGDTVFIGCSDGHLYGLDKRTGAMRWYYDLGIPTLATPCVSGNALFTAAYDGNVYAFTSE